MDAVTHCFVPEHMPFYGQALRIQLMSFVHCCPPKTPTRLWICHTDEPRTAGVLCQFRGIWHEGRLQIRSVLLPPAEMFRRAIGRNKVAHQIAHDSLGVAWLDADYFVAKGWEESFLALFRATDGPMAAYPRSYPICRDHATGDRLLAEWALHGPPAVPPADLFVPLRPPRAIGGHMFVRGDALHHGYCYEHQRRPLVGATRFKSFPDDISYRRFLADKGINFVKHDIKGIYRLRHTRAGYKDEDWNASNGQIVAGGTQAAT